jgi:phenylalanyl-tRNA synthetase beta chain
MKISLNWLSDWVDLTDLEPAELAERLTLGTAEVEGIEVVANAAEHAVVARVVAVEQLGESGPRAVTVDTGGVEHVTVTTATEVAVGMLVAYAPVGARLPGGTLAVTRIAGRESHGMLCAPSDLGLGPVADVLLRCPPDTPVGAALSTWIPARDVLVEIDNKSLTHRPDLWGHYGFAREFAALLRRPLLALDTVDLAAFANLPEVAVVNDGGDDCPCVTALAIDIDVDIDNAVPAPLAVQARLSLLGQRPVNLMVDLTNYVMLEVGQPTHAYDRDVVAGLRVAPAGEHPSVRTLDGQDRELIAEDLLIWSGREPVGLAGIMGCANSGVTEVTGRILLESANFRASRVRRTATRLNLRTDAGQRFEKSQPPVSTRTGTARIVRLLELCGVRHEVVSRHTVAGDLRAETRTIELAADHVQRVAGAPIPAGEVDAILTRLGFTVTRDADRLLVGVPAFRATQDIGIPADIVEEVLRVHGYAAIDPRPPLASLAPVPPNTAIRNEHKARRILAAGHGFVEVQTYLWTDDRWLARIGHDPGETLRLRNPVAPEKARLRSTLLPNLFQVVNDNLDAWESFAVFEIGRVVPTEDGRHREVSRLAGASVCPAKAISVENHYRRVKGALEDVVAAIGDGRLRVEPEDVADGEAPWRVPDVTARVYDDTGPVGTAGILLGPVLDAVARKRQVVWFELELDRLGGPLYPSVSYRPVPVYPESQQDFSILWPVARTYAGLERTLDEFVHPLAFAREFVMDYQGKGLPAGTGSYTFRYRLVHPERTLTGEDLALFRTGFLEFLAERGLSIR